MDKTAEQLIVELLKSQLSLSDSNVWVRNQTRTIPPDTGLYIVVGMTDSRPLSAETQLEERVVEDVVTMIEVQQVQTMDNIQIDIFSRSNQSLTRRWEVMAALASIQSKQIQEANFFKVCRLPNSFLNTSSAEGGSNLNRFSLSFNCFVWYRKERISVNEYYDDFKTRVDDYKTIGQNNGLIEFRIFRNDSEDLILAAQNGVRFKTQDGKYLRIQRKPVLRFRRLATHSGFMLRTNTGKVITVTQGA